MIEVAKNELPTNRTLPVMGASKTDFVYSYGIEVGYRNCLAVLDAMTQAIPEETEITPDFSDKNNNDDE